MPRRPSSAVLGRRLGGARAPRRGGARCERGTIVSRSFFALFWGGSVVSISRGRARLGRLLIPCRRQHNNSLSSHHHKVATVTQKKEKKKNRKDAQAPRPHLEHRQGQGCRRHLAGAPQRRDRRSPQKVARARARAAPVLPPDAPQGPGAAGACSFIGAGALCVCLCTRGRLFVTLNPPFQGLPPKLFQNKIKS